MSDSALNWKYFIRLTALIILLLGSMASRAGHIAGGNITYECIGNEEYLVTLSVFRNCSESSSITSPQQIKFASDCGSFFSLPAIQVFTDEVSQLCPSALANSACNGGPWPGMEIYKFQTTVVLDTCDSWQIFWELCTRSVTNNVDDTVFPCYRINATLNNADAPCNNSPSIAEESIPYVCVNQPVNFNLGVNEIDGDSLRFYLVPGLTAGGAPIPYEPGFSGLVPIPGINIGNNTGQLSFTPTATGTYTIVIEVEEFNSAGDLIGTIRQDIIFVVENCPQPPPQPDPGGFSNFTGTGTLVASNVIQVCGGDQFCAEMEFSSVNPSSEIALSSQIETILPGATFTQTGTNPAVAEVCWTVPPGFSNTYQINIVAQDDACPVFGVAYWGFVITPSVGVYGGPDIVICAGETVQLEATGDTDYLWQSFSGDPINEGVNFSCTDCPNPVVTPSETSVYLVTGLNNSTECIATDTVVVAISLEDLFVETASESCFLNDASIVVNIPFGSGDYDFLWETGDTTPTLLNIPAGDYDLNITDNVLGCTLDTTISVQFPPFPNTNAGPDAVSCAPTYIMQADSTADSGYWLAPDAADATFFPDIYTHDAEIIVVNNGTWTFYWIEDDGNACTGIDSVDITFTTPPPIEVEEDNGTCGLTYQLDADLPTIGSAYWTGPPGATFDPDEFDPNATVTVPNYGFQYITWNLDIGNGCGGADSVGVQFEQPFLANAGTTVDSVCGNAYQLAAPPPYGVDRFWSSNAPEISFDPDVDDPNASAIATDFGTYDIYWTVETAYCTNTDTISITFVEPPVANAGLDSIVCGTSYTLNPIPSVGTGSWNVPNGFTFDPSPDTANAVAYPPGYGSFELEWTEFNGFTCEDTDTLELFFVEVPVADAGPNDTICGLQYTLQATPSVGTGEWSSVDPGVAFDDINDPNTSVTVSTQGDYVFTWTEDNGYNCVNQDDTQITFYAIPTPDAGPDDLICGPEYSLQGAITVGDPTWEGPAGIVFDPDNNTADAAVNVSSYGLQQFILTEDNNGCVVSDTVDIEFVELPVADAGPDETVCGLEYIMQAIPSIGTGTWTAPAGVIVDDVNDPVSPISVAAEGVYEMIWTEDVGSGCTSQDTTVITFYAIPQPNAGTDDDICGLDYNLSGSTDFGVPTWSNGTGAIFSPDEFAISPATTASLYGVQTFVLTADNNGCITADTVEINFIEPPIANAGLDTSTCGLAFDLQASPSVGNAFWSGPPGYDFSPIALDPNAQVNAPGFGAATFTWTEDNQGCTDFAEVTINFVEQPTANPGSGQTVCGLEAALSATPSVGDGLWHNGSGALISPSADQPDVDVNANASGTVEFWWVENNGNGCVDSASIFVEFLEVPEANPGIDDAVCGLEYELQAVPSVGLGSWSVPAGLAVSDISDPNAIITASSPGSYTLFWVEELGPCADSAAVEIEFVNEPLADAGADAIVCGLEYTLDGFSNINSGTWIPVAGLSFSDANAEDATVTADSYGTYTLTWEVTGGANCFDSDEVEITFVEAPVAEAGPDGETCGLSFDLAAVPSTGNGEWSGPPGADFSDATDPNATVTMDGYGEVIFTWSEIDPSGCTTTDDVTVNFIEQPVADAGVDGVSCGLVFNLNATPTAGDGVWTTPDAGVIFTPDASDPNAFVEVPGQGTYSFTWTETNGACVSAASVSVEVTDQPEASAGSDDEICSLSYPLNASGNGGQWTGPPGVVFAPAADALNATVTVPNAGDYTFTWSIDNGNDCSDTDEVTISFYDTPEVSELSTTCINGNLNYIVEFTISGGDPATYMVTGDGTLNGNIFTGDPLTNGATYSYEVQDANGCDVVVVSGSNVCPNLTYAGTMNQTPLANCGDDPLTAIHNANNTLDGNDAFLFILHSNPSLPLGDVFAQGPNPTFGFQPGMTYGETYYISAVVGNSDGSGGIDFDDPLLSVAEGTPVVFYEIPTATISGGGSACMGDTLWAEVEFSGAPVFQFTYTFNGQVQQPLISNDLTSQIPMTESGQLLPIQVDNEFCEGQVDGVVNVQFNALPEAEISGDAVVCEGGSEEFMVELSGAAPFTFTYAINSNPQPAIITNDQTYNITATQAGIYSLLSVADQVCTGTTEGEAELEVTPYPEPVTGPDITVCYDDDEVQIGGPAVPGYEYDWNNGQFLSNDAASNPNVIFEDQFFVPVELDFTLTVVNNGCATSGEVAVTLLPVPEVQTNGSVSMCEDGAAQLQVSGADDINWQPNMYITDNTAPMPFVFPPEDMEYTVAVSNNYGCATTGSVQVVVNPMPNASFVASVDSACVPASISFQNLTDPSFTGSCFWNFGNGTVSSSCNSSVNGYFYEQGSYDVSLTVTSPEGCSFTTTQFDVVNTYGPVAMFDYDPSPADISNSKIQFQNLSTDAEYYMWDFDDYGNSMLVNPVVEYPSEIPGEYEVCLSAIDADGCYDEYCEVIEIAADLLIYIPNAFSPNGDGVNDLFYPVMQGVDIVEYEFQIFNRRGKLVWSTDNPDAKWDGSDKTREYLDDNQTYIWKLRIKDQYSSVRADRDGFVMVVR